MPGVSFVIFVPGHVIHRLLATQEDVFTLERDTHTLMRP